MKFVLSGIAIFILTGCTSIDVRPVESPANLGHVCIVNNPKVIISDFVDVLRDGFDRHSVPTSVVQPEAVKSCEVTLTYTALREWDFKPYLFHAELTLWRNGSIIGSAYYHLKGKGGLSLNKWGSTEEKLDPVIDQLLGAQDS